MNDRYLSDRDVLRLKELIYIYHSEQWLEHSMHCLRVCFCYIMGSIWWILNLGEGTCLNLTDMHRRKEGKSGARTQIRKLKGPGHDRVNYSRSFEKWRRGINSDTQCTQLINEHLIGEQREKNEGDKQDQLQASNLVLGMSDQKSQKQCVREGHSHPGLPMSRQRHLPADRWRAQRRESSKVERKLTFLAVQGSLLHFGSSTLWNFESSPWKSGEGSLIRNTAVPYRRTGIWCKLNWWDVPALHGNHGQSDQNAKNCDSSSESRPEQFLPLRQPQSCLVLNGPKPGSSTFPLNQCAAPWPSHKFPSCLSQLKTSQR